MDKDQGWPWRFTGFPRHCQVKLPAFVPFSVGNVFLEFNVFGHGGLIRVGLPSVAICLKSSGKSLQFLAVSKSVTVGVHLPKVLFEQSGRLRLGNFSVRVAVLSLPDSFDKRVLRAGRWAIVWPNAERKQQKCGQMEGPEKWIVVHGWLLERRDAGTVVIGFSST